MIKKRYIKKYRNKRKTPFYKRISDEYIMKEHMLNYGITTNITGTDGNVTPLLFTDFRHVADTSGMYRIFRILAFGME